MQALYFIAICFSVSAHQVATINQSQAVFFAEDLIYIFPSCPELEDT